MSGGRILVATGERVFPVDPEGGRGSASDGLTDRLPTCLAADPFDPSRAWCGTREHGVMLSEDAGSTWRASGLDGRRVMSLAASPAQEDLVWAGTEPSEVWGSDDGGMSWERSPGLQDLPSSSEWAFPPRPETHHVRWIACHPADPGRLWVAIEAGALVTTPDGGATWKDRVPTGPRDTHEVAVHLERPDLLRVSAGDGYYESHDGGASWSKPRRGLEVGYLRSVTVDPGDPEVVVVSASSRARTAYAAGRSDGRLYRRKTERDWERVREGWPDRPETIAPLLTVGREDGEMWAADERGLHRSGDGGSSWERIWSFPATPHNLRGLAVLVERAAG